ncbi:hypothetical protein K492DRAFT_175668 [Lichtheimia hyalospora FSU 10163]|nr:hypothetical protein K492DRAFT_175668 [Lichtheimia hyalospora FSU 10163]
MPTLPIHGCKHSTLIIVMNSLDDLEWNPRRFPDQETISITTPSLLAHTINQFSLFSLYLPSSYNNDPFP